MPIAGRLPAVALAVATVFLALVVADAHSYAPERTNPQERKPCGHEATTHRHGIADAKHTEKLERLRHFARCARTPAKERRIRARIEALKEARRSDCIPGVTVYSLGDQCLSIPGEIVACESHGSWSAYNPSGAAAIYQIMPEHGRPWPVDSVADKRAHHRIAADLYAGGAGASNWVCSA